MAENGSRADNGKYQPICQGGGLLLAWQLKGKRVLLVGGGPVAAGECSLKKKRLDTRRRRAEPVLCRRSDVMTAHASARQAAS